MHKIEAKIVLFPVIFLGIILCLCVGLKYVYSRREKTESEFQKQLNMTYYVEFSEENEDGLFTGKVIYEPNKLLTVSFNNPTEREIGEAEAVLLRRDGGGWREMSFQSPAESTRTAIMKMSQPGKECNSTVWWFTGELERTEEYRLSVLYYIEEEGNMVTHSFTVEFDGETIIPRRE